MAQTPADASASTVRSVDRALDLLELLERSDSPLRLVELSRGSGLQNATVLRILGSLQHRGPVQDNGRHSGEQAVPGRRGQPVPRVHEPFLPDRHDWQRTSGAGSSPDAR